MSAVNRVIDYMSGLPSAAEHATTYATEFTNRVAKSDIVVIDGVEEEKKMIPSCERAILGRLDCQVKFTRKDFALCTRIGVSVCTEGPKYIRRHKVIDLDFEGYGDWFLEPVRSRALYSAKESTVHLLDGVQKAKIMAKCPNMSGSDANDVYMMSVHERISIPTDMRHIFMKMYLLLQDYNLAVTSKSGEVSIAEGILPQMHPFAGDLDRLAAVTLHSVVIDADGFTPAELGLLTIASQSYPSVWYTHDNIYTKCNMEADDLIIIADGAIDVDTSMLWGSPDRLYHMMWTVACKLNCVGHLISAFESMRGKCQMMADMTRRVDSNRVSSMVPLSYSMESAFGGDYGRATLTNAPGYFSTSIALVADMLYGLAFEAAASCVAEAMGACGTLLSSRTPTSNRVMNGLMRDFGLQHTSSEDNFLLQNWDIMVGRPMTWDFGPILKDYLLDLASDIINGRDIPMPQILHAIPSLTAVNTCFGLARGWTGPAEDVITSKRQRADDTDGMASFAWMMGEREARPQVFFNRSGKKPTSLGHNEYHLQSECDGHFGIGSVRFTVADSLGGRVDENEETSSALFRTEYAGTVCSIVFNRSEERWVTHAIRDPPGRQSFRKDPPSGNDSLRVIDDLGKPTQPASALPLRGVNWGSSPKENPAEMFQHLAALSRSNAIVPSSKPRHARVTSGEPTVTPYMIDGNMEQALLSGHRKEVGEGDEISFSRINVPGDGRCGIHAVVEDLKVHGLIAPGDAARTTELFSGSTASQTFHDAQELAALSQQWGMNLDVIDVGTGSLHKYGKGDDRHTITIVRDGNHFDAAAIGTGANKVKINKVHKQENSPEEFVAAVARYGNLFGSVSN